jgi:uncharacterized protein YggE
LFCFKSIVSEKIDPNETRNFAMRAFEFAVRTRLRSIVPVAAAIFATLSAAAAQAQNAQPEPPARVVVIGEGKVTVAPDYARVRNGVSTSAKTVKEASDSNSKTMANILATLADAGIAKKDIQTSEFSIEPVYASPTPPGGPKVSGYRVTNQVNVTIRDLSQVGDILDRLIKAGATDAGNISFLVSDREKALDQAREAAMANARHKAELYAQAAGLALGHVSWISEGSDLEPVRPMALSGDGKMASTPVPIESGEGTITARVTVGFGIAQ